MPCGFHIPPPPPLNPRLPPSPSHPLGCGLSSQLQLWNWKGWEPHWYAGLSCHCATNRSRRRAGTSLWDFPFLLALPELAGHQLAKGDKDNTGALRHLPIDISKVDSGSFQKLCQILPSLVPSPSSPSLLLQRTPLQGGLYSPKT